MKVISARFGPPGKLRQKREPVVTLEIVLSRAEAEEWGHQGESHHALADRMIAQITMALSVLGTVITRALGPRKE